MDPTANLKEQLTLSDAIKKRLDEDPWCDLSPLADRLAELVSDLHHWISKGGALPDQWRRP